MTHEWMTRLRHCRAKSSHSRCARLQLFQGRHTGIATIVTGSGSIFEEREIPSIRNLLVLPWILPLTILVQRSLMLHSIFSLTFKTRMLSVQEYPPEPSKDLTCHERVLLAKICDYRGQTNYPTCIWSPGANTNAPRIYSSPQRAWSTCLHETSKAHKETSKVESESPRGPWGRGPNQANRRNGIEAHRRTPGDRRIQHEPLLKIRNRGGLGPGN